MENTKTPAGEGTRGTRENHKTDPNLVIGSKPLHRFIRGEPRSLGIVVMICGFAEVLMGFQLARDPHENSTNIYIPFWQGALFLVSGNLSLYTGAHPSKTMVTVCFAMYLVSLLGIIVSLSNRIVYMHEIAHLFHYSFREHEWTIFRIAQLMSIEVILFISSLCVSVLLIFLSVMARLALKSTNTQFPVGSSSYGLPPPDCLDSASAVQNGDLRSDESSCASSSSPPPPLNSGGRTPRRTSAQMAEMMSQFLNAQASGQGCGQALSSTPDLLPMLQDVCGQVTQCRLDANAAARARDLGDIMERRLEEMERRLKEHMDRRLDALEDKLDKALQAALPRLSLNPPAGGSSSSPQHNPTSHT